MEHSRQGRSVFSMKVIIIVLAFTLTIFQGGYSGSAARSLPKSFIRCKKTDPNLSKCVQKAVEDSFQKMKTNGIPSLGVLPLDPLDVQDMKLNSGTPNDPVNLRIDFKNMKIRGIPDTTFKDYNFVASGSVTECKFCKIWICSAKFKAGKGIKEMINTVRLGGADLENTQIHTISHSPLITFDAEYKADGKILIVPVTGQGAANFTMYDMETVCHLIFKPEERAGEKYWIIQDYQVKFNPKKMNMYFSGIISQDKTLSDGINNFINENWEAVFQGVRSGFEEAFGAVFKEITNRVFTKVPINKIFLD